MLIADGGGGYAGTTNWYQHNAETIWKTVENQQTDNHWSVVNAWKMASELSLQHMSRLTMHRDALAEAWPPEKSEAAREYIDRFNFLIDTVKATYDQTSANYETFKNVTLALGDSRTKLKPLYDEYIRKRQAKADYDARVEAEKSSLLPGTSLGDPPTTDAELEQLNNRARSVMYGLSGELVQAKAQIKPPPTYKPAPGRTEKSPEGGGNDFINTPPPVIPSPFSVSAVQDVQASPPNTQKAIQVVPTPTPTPPGAGPVLGGVGTLPPAPPINPPSPSVITPTPPTPPGITPTVPIGPLMPPAAGGGPGVGRIGPPTAPLSNVAAKAASGGVPGALRAMPPGGLIGAGPGVGLGQPGPVPGAARRINPVGGMIPTGGTGTTPIGGATQRSVTGPTHLPPGGAQRSGGSPQRPGSGPTHLPIGGSQPPASSATRPRSPVSGAGRSPLSGPGPSGSVSAVGRAGQWRNEETGRHWDQSTSSTGGRTQRERQPGEWETDEGVSPVMMPAPESGQIDPGPAIGRNQ